MRRGATVALSVPFLIYVCARLAAQAPQTQQPVFRGGVSLVTVDVRVVDKDGKPAPGLTKDDFVVTLDGQPRPVSTLDYEVFGRSTTREAAPVAGAATASNDPAAAATASRGGRVFLIVIDDLSAQPLQMKGLLVSGEKMLATLDPSDMVGIVTTSGLGPVVNPTRDRAQVLAVLRGKGVVGRAESRPPTPFVTVKEAIDMVLPGGDPTVRADVVARECGTGTSPGRRGGISPDDSMCAVRVDTNARYLAARAQQLAAEQAQAYTHAIQALAAAPRPRTLIALSGGVPLYPGQASVLDTVSHAAADANVTFQALIAQDDMDIGQDDSPARAKAHELESRFLADGMHEVAIAAGGDAVRVIGQADRFYTRIVNEAGAVYHLGVEAPATTKPEHFLSLKVSVKKPNLSVRTNSHAVQPAVAATGTAAPTATAVPVTDLLKQRIQQGGTAFGVPLSVTTARRRDAGSNRVQLMINVNVPAATPAPLNEIFAVVDATGHIIQSSLREMPAVAGSDYRLTFAVPLEADAEFHLRVGVGDANGAVGSIEQPVSTHLTSFGTTTASDLTLVDVAADGPHLLAKDTLPAHSTRSQITLELYPADPARVDSLGARLTIKPVGSDTPLVDSDVQPTSRDGRVIMNATFSPETIPVGEYEVTMIVTDGGKPVGTMTAKLRKVE